MLKVTTRYLASNFIPPFAIGFVFFVAFLITFYMFRIINLIVNKGVDALTVFGLVGDLSVSFFPLATPLAVFFATIYTLNKFSEDSEIIAMRSFGITKFKLYTPFLGISIVIALTVFSLNNIYIPNANANFRNTIVRLTSTGMLSSIKSGQFFTDIPNVTLFAEEVVGDGDVFEEIFLHLREKTGEERIIMASEGALVKIFGDSNNPPSLRLHLKDGNIVKIKSSGNEVEKILFEQYDFPIFSAEIGNSKLDKDVMKVTSELLVSIAEKEATYKNLLAKNDQSDASKNLIKDAKKNFVKAKLELYERFLTVPQVILFVLLGFTLGIKKGRGGNSGNSAKAFMILIGYYGFYFFFVSLAQRGSLDAAVASFTPSVILFIISLYFYRKLDWVG